MRQVPAALRVWLALVLLNASLTFENVWPTPWIQWGHGVAVELAACVALLVAARRWADSLARRVLPVLWVLLVVGRYLAVTAPGLYGREFNLYWDARHLGNVAAMLAGSTPWSLIGASVAGLGAALGLIYVLARLALGQIAAAAVHRGPRVALASLATGVIVLFGTGLKVAPYIFEGAFADPVMPAYVRQARFALALLGPGATAPRLGASPALDTPLDALGGVDVVLVFVESYGAITFETPGIADALAESRADFAASIRETGRDVVSAYVESPTFGASSWLAHLTLLSGVDVRDQYAYAALMASDRETMVTNFARRGYRTVALMPGMRQAWPEGAFYGFDVIYGRDQFEYEGPQFGWWSIPDQYALARLDALERRASARRPLFVVFPTSTSHAPFGPVPPYQPEWTRVLAPDPFEQRDVERAMAQPPDLSNLRPSYVRAIAYEYRSLAGYLRQQDDDLVLVVVGDHQPPAAVSGPDASSLVPVHVIGRRQRSFDRLRARGFRTGVEPAQPMAGRMHELTAMLLEAFGKHSSTIDER